MHEEKLASNGMARSHFSFHIHSTRVTCRFPNSLSSLTPDPQQLTKRATTTYNQHQELVSWWYILSKAELHPEQQKIFQSYTYTAPCVDVTILFCLITKYHSKSTRNFCIQSLLADVCRCYPISLPVQTPYVLMLIPNLPRTGFHDTENFCIFSGGGTTIDAIGAMFIVNVTV